MAIETPAFAMHDLECPRCGADLHGLACSGCDAAYEKVWGVPFIGDYERADALGLIEIAAHVPKRAELRMPQDIVQTLDGVCERYHAASDKAAFIGNNPRAGEWDFQNRYDEWRTFYLLIDGLDFRERRVLDIGAGHGFDSQRLSLLGAQVTALEFNPIRAEAGQGNFPHIRWIGGFSHALPFKSASFDAVFCNSALHHMRDIPAAIAEALRVLRPGGILITTGDPFRADDTPEFHELEIFDRHEHALLGINEQIPRFSDFVRTFEENADCVEAGVFTYMLYGGRSGKDPNLTEWTRWDLALDGRMLKQRAGGISLRVKLLKDWPRPRLLQTEGVLSPVAFASLLHEESEAISTLAALMPDEDVNKPFRTPPSKFDLLNGWRLGDRSSGIRTAYRRGRWFLIRNDEEFANFSIRSPAPANFSVFLDAKPVRHLAATAQWQKIAVDLTGITPSKRYVLEIRRDGKAADFDSNCFQVRRREVHRPGLFWHLARRLLRRGMEVALTSKH
jgi:ubiquinone/menaquinone biosynthesis C-methylase UbiE